MLDVERLKSDLPEIVVFLDAWCRKAPRPIAKHNWVCPVCGSGEGKNATPALSANPDGRHWRCFSCGTSGDAFDLAEKTGHGSSFDEGARAVCCAAGLDFFSYGTRSAPSAAQVAARERIDSEARCADAAKERDAEEKIASAQRDLERNGDSARSYLMGRGFTHTEIEKFGFGAVEGPGVLVPWPSGSYWTVRHIGDGHQQRYDCPKGMKKPLWDCGAADCETVWIVEGPFDALSLEAVGVKACALGTTRNRTQLEAFKGKKGLVVVALDSDEPGRKAADEAISELRRLGVRAIKADWGDVGAKDASELFALCRDDLSDFCRKAEDRAKEDSLSARGVSRASTAMFKLLDPSEQAEPFQTGLACIDDALEGGLPAGGLTVIGAVSSAGKTTLCVQLADRIAEAGHLVLFVSCEQGSRELQAKSIVRTAHNLLNVGLPVGAILTKKGRESLTERQEDAFQNAANIYARKVADRLFIMQPNGRPTPGEIRSAVEELHAAYGAWPAVFVDYLQLLGSDTDQRADAKKCADEAVTALRQVARITTAPVVAVSSLSRQSYNGVLSLESFKESGAIEYGADLLVGLEPVGLSDAADGKAFMREWKESPLRDVSFTVLKNRNGRVSTPKLRFNAPMCAFYDLSECEEQPRRPIRSH